MFLSKDTLPLPLRLLYILIWENFRMTYMEKESKSNESIAIIDLDIQDIEGVGPTTARKLKDAGIVSVMDLAVSSAEELSESINATKETAASFIIAAQKLLRETNVLDKEFVTADAALQKRRSMLRCSTGSYAFFREYTFNPSEPRQT